MSNQSKFKISIAHLYPKLLNLYGDFGNILALKNRCILRNIDVEIRNLGLNENFNVNDFDIFFIGGGQDQQQSIVAKDLQRNKQLYHDLASLSKVFLGICGGFQLFGKYYKPFNKEEQPGLELLDIYTLASNKRLIGNLTLKTDIIPNHNVIKMVGFENHSGLTFIERNTQTKPISKVIVGNGNNGKDKTEGAYKYNVFGTYCHGPFLPKNPKFTDFLIKKVLKTKYNYNIDEFKKLDDKIEEKTLNFLINKPY